MAAENNIVGEVGLIVKPIDPNSQFQTGIDSIIKKLEKQAQFQVKASGLEEVQQQANNAGAAFAQAAIEAAGFTAAVFGIRSAIEGAINKMSGLFDQLAQARAGFTSILKSEAAGGQLLADIREFARVSPFVTQELVNYSQQLLGVGVSAQKIVPLLASVGDIVSSVGGDTQNIGRVLFTLTQIQSIGRLAGQDAMQLQSSLIPITKYLSDYMHKTTAEVKKMQEAGTISAATVFAAIQAQGEKVKGAMSNATRNIAGARAVLSDTVTIMLQNQPVLNKIFEDIWKGIVKFSDALSSPEFTAVFTRFFDGVNKLYEGVKPLVSELGKIGGGQILSAMGQTASLFSMIGDVLGSLPKPVIEALARLLIAMAALKAPLMLIQYVQNIQRMAGALVPAVTGMTRLGQVAAANVSPINAETAAIERSYQALTKRQRALFNDPSAAAGGGSKARQFLSAQAGKIAVGATLGGSYLSGSDNTGAQAAGSALSFGAMGFMLAGPAGGAAGAAIGAITSFSSAAEARAQAHVEAMKKLGTEAATAFIEREGKGFSSDDTFGAAQDIFNKQVADLERQRADAQSKLNQARANGVDKVFEGLTTGWNGIKGKREKKEDSLEAQLAGIVAVLDDVKAAGTSAVEPMQIGLRSLVPMLDKTQAAFDALTMHTGHAGRVATTDIGQAQAALAKYGITLTDLADPAKLDWMLSLINSFDGLTTAQQNATKAANDFNTAFKEAAAAAAAIFDPQQTQITSQIAYLEAVKAAADANTKSGLNGGDVVSRLQAENAALKAQESAYSKSLAGSASGIAAAGRGLGSKEQRDSAQAAAKTEAATRANEAGERAYEDAIRSRSFAQAQARANALSGLDIVRLKTEEEMTRWLELTGLVDNLDNRTLIINMVSDSIVNANTELAKFQETLRQMNAAGQLDVGQNGFEARMGAMGRGAFGDATPDKNGNYGDDALAAQIKAAEELVNGEKRRQELIRLGEEMARKEQQARDDALRKAEQWSAAVDNATDSLMSSVTTAVDAIKSAADSWTANIKERVQYETAVSTGRLIGNTKRQIADLAELSAGMENLRARGVTDEVMKKLGIDNVADVRQVRKLVNSSDSSLAELTGLVGTLNSDAVKLATTEEDTRTRKNIEEGIKAAATALGYTNEEARGAVAGIAANFNITAASSPEEVAMAIIGILTAGRTGI